MNIKAKGYYYNKLKKQKDLKLRDFKLPDFDSRAIKKIHLIGVCGTAMGSLAGLFAKAGYAVSGSDTECYPPMDSFIKELGIEFKEGYSISNVQGSDLVIVGNAVGPGNVEAAYAREHQLPQMSLSEALARFFIEGKRSLVVAGTHGKTTTTGMLAHVLQHIGFDPSYMIGGVMQSSGESFRLGKGAHFVIEGDEYDTSYFDKSPKFLHYLPTHAIITSLEFDHVDIYDDIEDYTQAFKFLVEEMAPEGTLFLYGDDENVRALAIEAECNVRFYGLAENNNITARNITNSSVGQEFDLIVDGEVVERFSITLNGEHNLLNALSVAGMALEEGVTPEELKEGLRTFEGMKRRQEIVGEEKGITVIDDFAHHPSAVRETIKAMKEKYPNQRLIAIFEPRSNTSRRKLFENDYIKSFDGADLLCLKVPPLRHNDTPEDFIDGHKVVDEIMKRGTKSKLYINVEDIIKDMTSYLEEGDVVLIMSNGSFEGIHQKLLEALRKN